jgi:hypothetical protein
MSNEYSVGDLLEFLEHSADRGLMPPATANALAVACRNVFAVLSDSEKQDVRNLDVEGVIRRFQNKRAKDFSTDTLAEYGRRVKRAIQLYADWKANPGGFRAPRRTTRSSKKRGDEAEQETIDEPTGSVSNYPTAPGSYQTAIPLAPGRIVILHNVPSDLTAAEAERLAAFVRMLPISPSS